MGRTIKLTISLPEELILFTDEFAKKKRISRSKVISLWLKELAEKQKTTEMEEGYKFIAKEQKQFTAMASGTELEVIPDWE
jgi:metal-responsive CopG/Arc/MetJ family transcriptional regulator